MRRALLKKLPALSFYYGLKPWELADLTFDEIREFQRQLPRSATVPKQRRRR